MASRAETRQGETGRDETRYEERVATIPPVTAFVRICVRARAPTLRAREHAFLAERNNREENNRFGNLKTRDNKDNDLSIAAVISN